MNVLVLLLLPGIGAVLAPLLARASRRLCASVCGLLVVSALGWLIALSGRAFDGSGIVAGWQWMPAIGLDLHFRLDGLAFLFGLLILAVGLLIVVYSHFYLRHEAGYGRFYAFLMFFMSSMLGIVLSENLLLLVVFWELTSLSSFLLIGFHRNRRAARVGAVTALTVTAGGGLALLAGVLMLGHVVGSFDLSDVLAAGDAIGSDALHLPILVLVLLGVFTKSAQFPFHFWLPPAMSAPTPVSAYLHSAAMVKAGVFLLARLHPALAGDPSWLYLVAGTGLVTLVLGAFVAMFKHDIKSLLAYSTISHLGLIVFLLGLGHPVAVVAGLLHVVNHATFKASLFMAAGIVSHESGSRDTRRLGGLWQRMPHTAVLAAIATASMAGVPLLNGFISKEMFFSEALAAHRVGWIAPVAALAFGVFSVTYSARFLHDVFFYGDPQALPKSPQEPRLGLRVPVGVLVTICVLIGVAPSLVVGGAIHAAVRSTLQSNPPDYDLAVWHGFTPALAMSLVSLAGGVLLYVWLQRRFRLHRRTPKRSTIRHAFNRGAAAVTAMARHGMSLVEPMGLSMQVALAIGVTLLGSLWAFGVATLPGWPASATQASVEGWVGALTLTIAVAGVVRWRSQPLTAVVFAGVAGLVLAVGFLRLSAPDLGLAQLCIEMVSVVLLLLALRWLPLQRRPRASRARIARQSVLALAGGTGLGVLAYLTMTWPLDSISGFFVEHAAASGGENIVNMILVDFRSLDTLGEVTVLGIAALAVYALLGNGVRDATDAVRSRGPAEVFTGDSLLMITAARILVPLLLLMAVHLFLRGHDHPGGGFIAGLVIVIAMILQYMGAGLAGRARRLGLDAPRVIATGLLTVLLTGSIPMLLGKPFLTSGHASVELPVLGAVDLSSTLLFDLGVVLLVVGATLVYLLELARSEAPEAPGDRRWS